MKKKVIWIVGGLIIAAVLVIAGINETQKNKSEVASTTETSIGSQKAATDKDYTLKEMLTYAIQDEYMAQAVYAAIIDKYGKQQPFYSIAQAEGMHINMLLPLLKKYDVAVPENDAENRVAAPASLQEGYTAGIESETNNIAMFKSFLKEDLPDDVKAVFETLVAQSENHLNTFERASNGTMGNGMGNGNGRGPGGMNRSGGNSPGNGTGDCPNQ